MSVRGFFFLLLGDLGVVLLINPIYSPCSMDQFLFLYPYSIFLLNSLSLSANGKRSKPTLIICSLLLRVILFIGILVRLLNTRLSLCTDGQRHPLVVAVTNGFGGQTVFNNSNFAVANLSRCSVNQAGYETKKMVGNPGCSFCREI